MLNLVGVSLLPIVALLVAADVTGRYVFNSPVPGTLDTAQLLQVIIVCFALAYTAAQRGHVSVDMVVSRLPHRAQAIIASLTGLISLPILWLLTYEAVVDGVRIWRSGLQTSVLHMPIYPFKFLLALGFFALCLELSCQWLGELSHALKKKGSS